MVHEAALPVITAVALLTTIRGRFRIWKRQKNYRLVLSIIANAEARGSLELLANKMGGCMISRETHRGRQIAVLEIQDQKTLRLVVDTITKFQDEDGLELSPQMQHEVGIAWSFLNTPVARGKMDEEKRSANMEAMEERERLYKLMNG